MTRDEAKAKYGDVKCSFSSYYKYYFSFSGNAADGSIISFSLGGTSSDIYKMPVNKNDTETINNNDNCEHEPLSFSVKIGDQEFKF